jgi:hypothetical protein
LAVCASKALVLDTSPAADPCTSVVDASLAKEWCKSASAEPLVLLEEKVDEEEAPEDEEEEEAEKVMPLLRALLLALLSSRADVIALPPAFLRFFFLNMI